MEFLITYENSGKTIGHAQIILDSNRLIDISYVSDNSINVSFQDKLTGKTINNIMQKEDYSKFLFGLLEARKSLPIASIPYKDDSQPYLVWSEFAL